MFNRLNGARFVDKARDIFSESRDLARTGADRASDFIHAKPVASAMMGFGAGILIGVLFWRRRRPAGKDLSPRSFSPARAGKRKTVRA